MSLTKQHVVFDIVGTCVSYDVFFDRIHSILGSRLLAQNITAAHFGFSWLNAAELEFTYLSISDQYIPFRNVMGPLFYRTLWMAGIQDPRRFATDEERDACIEAYSELEIRPGCRECFQTLRDNGYTVWCFTSGDVQRVRGYFERAGIDIPLDNFVSCDTEGVAKPALRAYSSVLDKLGGASSKWFAAAHMWDVSAAVRAGFTGAYCKIYEKEPCEDLFKAKITVMADTLPELASGIIANSRQ